MKGNIENIEVIKDKCISDEEDDFYTIFINGKAVLHCVPYRLVGVAIGEFIKNPKLF